jgi:branched-chain amino acid transport system substrate-binding protein
VKKRILFIGLALLLVVSMVAIGCEEEETTTPTQPTTPTTPTTPTVTPPEQDEIVIGASRDITGPQAGFQQYGFAPIYKMWAEEVNAAGGINVAGKMLTVRIIEYDDMSDPAACTRNLEKLITEDNVDFLFGPTGTAMLFSAAPIANKYGKLMICGEGGATTLEPKLPDMPYVFSVLNYSNHFQIPVFAEIVADAGAETAYIMYMADLHGAEYNLTAQSEFTLHGIQVVGSTSIPITITDMNPIIEEARALEPDIFCSFAYPNHQMLLMDTVLTLDYSPNCLLLGPGGNFEFFSLIYGEALEGVMVEGAWNRKSSEAANELTDRMVEAFGLPNLDWWGALVYYSALQHFQQAIEEAASLDSDAVRDVMATAHYETTLGEMWWDIQGENGGALLPQECYAGQIGQWQSGIFEVIDPGEKRTADPIYPKPPWPE